MLANISMKVAAVSGEGALEFCKTAFWVCIVLAVVFLAIAVFLFFFFDIRNIFDIRTGRAEKRVISEMEAENALTGRLTNPKAKLEKQKARKKTKASGSKQHTAFSEKLEKLKGPQIPVAPAAPLNPSFGQQKNYSQQAYAPTPLMEVPKPVQPMNSVPPVPAPVAPVPPAPQTSYDMQQTTVLGNADAQQTTVLGNADAQQTTVLGNADAQQTTVLGNQDAQQTTVLSNQPAPAYAAQPQYDSADSMQTSVLGQPTPPPPAPAQPAPVPQQPAPAQYAQPVHNIAQHRTELGKAADSIDFKVGGGETGRLDEIKSPLEQSSQIKFNIVKNIMLIHTQETID